MSKKSRKRWRLSTFDQYMNLNIFIRMFYPFDIELPMFSHLLQLYYKTAFSNANKDSDYIHY